jgi:predicted phage terminase large subunit-like protein
MNALYTRANFDVITRGDLNTFIQRTFAELNPGTNYADNWHIELMAAELTAIANGETRRAIINLPPRNLKSICASVAVVAWILGRDPTKRVMVVSYGMDLAEKHARDCRQVMTSEWYLTLFPGTRLSPTRTSVADFETTAGGGRMATSRGGSVTGRGADLIIIDDPVKPDEALSEGVRTQANDYIAHTLLSRLNDKATGAVLVVMQRLHEDDPTGYLMRSGGWRHICLPAVATEDETWCYRTPYGPRTVMRNAGHALHPAREPLAVLAELRATQGEYHFTAQYQQQPAPLEGNLIKLAGFSRYEAKDLPDSFDELIQSWDTANKAHDLADFSVCVSIGRKGRFFYVLSVERQKMEYPLLKQQVIALRDRDRPSRVLIEDGASGQQLLQDLRYAGVGPVVACKPQGDKVMRLMTASPLIEAGRVFLPHAAPWLVEFEHELAGFPHGRFDDQVDAFSQALNWLNEAGREDAILVYYREETERARRLDEPGEPIVPLRPPPHLQGVSMATGRLGHEYRPDPQGVFWVREMDAPALCGAGWERLDPETLRRQHPDRY